MADAEIIPIGTRGRPGRGTGEVRPSSSARQLAPRRPAPAKKPAPHKAAENAADGRRVDEPVAPRPESVVEQVTTEAVPAAPPTVDQPRPAATTTARGPLGGIAPDVWLSMLTDAARDVYGEQPNVPREQRPTGKGSLAGALRGVTGLASLVRRTLHLRFNDLQEPEPIPLGVDYASVIESDVPIVVQHTRLDSRQPANALLSTIAYAG